MLDPEHGYFQAAVHWRQGGHPSGLDVPLHQPTNRYRVLDPLREMHQNKRMFVVCARIAQTSVERDWRLLLHGKPTLMSKCSSSRVPHISPPRSPDPYNSLVSHRTHGHSRTSSAKA